MYSRNDYLNSDICWRQSVALSNTGLDWNYYIAKQIDRDLHERLLDFSSSDVIQFLNILPLISSGYFYTAKQLVMAADVDESLTKLKQWLINSLTEADDT